MRMLANLRNVSRASSVSAHFRRHASTGTRKHKIVVVGGGAGGLSSAAMLLRKGGLSADVAVVEPSSSHFYQPLWTLVGGPQHVTCPRAWLAPSRRSLAVAAAPTHSAPLGLPNASESNTALPHACPLGVA